MNCLARDITAPAHLAIALVGVQCDPEQKSFQSAIYAYFGLVLGY